MTFDDFKREIRHYLVMADITTDPRFWVDSDKGMFICDVRGGYRFTANTISKVITIINRGRKFTFKPIYIGLNKE